LCGYNHKIEKLAKKHKNKKIKNNRSCTKKRFHGAKKSIIARTIAMQEHL
jgi:hypothetical protein